MQNANKHLHKLKDWIEIEIRLGNVLHNSLTIFEFEEAWSCMLAEYGLQTNKWLTEVYKIRYMWVPAFFKDTFWAGMTSTQRSEGINNLFKTFINLNSTLTEFVQQFSLALAKRVQDEARETFNSRNSPIQLSTNFVYEKVYQEFYIITKFAEIQEQLAGVQYLNTKLVWEDNLTRVYVVCDQTRKCLYFKPDGVNLKVRYDRQTTTICCECRNYEYRGIPCSHVFKIMLLEGFRFGQTCPETT